MTERTAEDLVDEVGHPIRLWNHLIERVQAENTTSFSTIEAEWCSLMWALDRFRTYQVVPDDFRKPKRRLSADIDAFYRAKGNWFARLLTALLQNWTSQSLSARANVQGYSQTHQIDVAWPRGRPKDPRICIETKVMGAPSILGSNPTRARPARADWSNRRKEVKFAATDLKLHRRDQRQAIDHWDQWRLRAWPKTYLVLAARLEPGKDDISKVISEVRSLTDTYLDGAGVAAWTPSADGTHYQTVPLPHGARVHSLDDVIHRLAAEIRELVASDGPSSPPPGETTD